MNSTKPLCISEFSKLYGELIAVDNLNLEVNAGEVFGFLALMELVKVLLFGQCLISLHQAVAILKYLD